MINICIHGSPPVETPALELDLTITDSDRAWEKEDLLQMYRVLACCKWFGFRCLHDTCQMFFANMESQMTRLTGVFSVVVQWQVIWPIDLIQRTDSPGIVMKLVPQTVVLVLWRPVCSFGKFAVSTFDHFCIFLFPISMYSYTADSHHATVVLTMGSSPEFSWLCSNKDTSSAQVMAVRVVQDDDDEATVFQFSRAD